MPRTKKPIPIPAGVNVELLPGEIRVTGPKGTLVRNIPPSVKIELAGAELVVNSPTETKAERSLGGSVRSHILNMLRGVERGFSRKLILEGVGYRVRQESDTLVFELGYSHPVRFPIPEGVKVEIEKEAITLSSPDRELLGSTAAKIRALRPPDPYKGKGIRYAEETLRLKPGKRAVAAA